MKRPLSLCCASPKETALSEVAMCTVCHPQGKALMFLANTRCRKHKPAAPNTARNTSAATLLPLKKATVTRPATQSSEMPLMETPAVPHREKTLSMTQSLTPNTPHAPGETPHIPPAALHYLVLLHPLDRPQMAAEQLSSPWKHSGNPAASDLGLLSTSLRITASHLTTRGPPSAHAAPLPRRRFKWGGTPPPRAPWSPLSQANSQWGPRDGTGRSTPCWLTCRGSKGSTRGRGQGRTRGSRTASCLLGDRNSSNQPG